MSHDAVDVRCYLDDPLDAFAIQTCQSFSVMVAVWLRITCLPGRRDLKLGVS